MRSRFWSFAHVLLLVAVVFIVPACGTNKKLAAPALMTSTPMHLDSNVAIIPNIVFKFDRAMDPAFMTGTYVGFFEHGTNNNVAFTVEFLPALDELRILPTGQLAVSQAYDVFVSGQVKSAAGTPMGSNEGITFTTKTSTTTISQIAFSTPTVANTANPGEINLQWSAATESTGTPVNVPNYDIYVSTAPDSEDLLIVPPPLLRSSSLTGGLFTLTPLTTYYIKVQPRDSSGSVLLNLAPIGPVTTN